MQTESPPLRAHYHHGDLPNALIDAATALAREGGPQAVVLREAARRVGVSPAAAYRHFLTHEQLQHAVRVRALGALAAAIEHALSHRAPQTEPAADALCRLRVIGSSYVRFALAEPGLFRSAFHPRIHAAATARSQPLHLLTDALDRLVACGLLPPERRAHAEFPAWAAFHGLATLFLDDGPGVFTQPEQREAALRRTLETVVNGLTR